MHMITREQSIDLIKAHVSNENIVKHMFALEALMGRIHDHLTSQGKTVEDLGGTKEEWKMAGLLHDGDYADEVPHDQQGIQIIKWARKNGFEVPENVAHATAAHNWHNTGVEPVNLMDWTIFCGDSLTGLIVASALVLPTRKLADVKVSSILKRFKEPSFAKGTRREEIALCQEKLGISLEEFISLSLVSMQQIASDMGL